MKKTLLACSSFLLLLLVLSGGYVYSAAPLDENFDSSLSTSNTVNSLTVGGLEFTSDGLTDGSSWTVNITTFGSASEGSSGDAKHFKGNVIVCDYTGMHNPKTFQFSSTDLSNNFRLNSLYVLGTMLTSGGSSQIDIKGYDGGTGGTLKAQVTGIDLATSGPYGEGGTQITYANTINIDTEKGGLLSFGPGWKGIDTVVFTDTNNDQPLEIALDSLDISGSDLLFKGYIDNPKASQTVNGTLSVSGWALDNEGVKKVEVIIDDEITREAVYGMSRPDVNKVYPQYENLNSGFAFTMDSKALKIGRHTAIVKVTNNLSVVTPLRVIEFNVSRPVIGCMDNPKTDMEYSGSVFVSGWVLDLSGVEKIDVYVDDRLTGEAVYGFVRNDVYNIFTEYNNRNSGFNFSIRTESLEPGIHSVKIEETGKDGKAKIIAVREFLLAK